MHLLSVFNCGGMHQLGFGGGVGFGLTIGISRSNYATDALGIIFKKRHFAAITIGNGLTTSFFESLWGAVRSYSPNRL